MKLSKISLPVQITIGLILGVACGLFFGELTQPLGKLGHAFVMLLKMSILPYMSFSLIHAIGSLTPSQGKRVASSGLLALLLIWILSLCSIYLVQLMFPEIETALFHSEPLNQELPQPEMLQLFIPVNPFHALANGIVPAVVLFSLIFGVALMNLDNKAVLLSGLDVGCQALTLITRWVTQLSPIGVFALIAYSVGETPFDKIEKIQLYIIAFNAGISILCLLTIPLLIGAITPIPTRAFMLHMRPAVLLSFTTGNALVSLPYIVSGLEELLEEYKVIDREGNRKAVETMVPLAYNFPTIGNVFSILFLLFTAFFYGQSFSVLEHFKLVGTGMAVLFGAGSSVIAGITFLIDAMRLPIDGVGLFLETMPMTRHFQTMGSTLGIGATTVLTVIFLENKVQVSWKYLTICFASSVLAIGSLILLVGALNLGSHKTSDVFSKLSLSQAVASTVFKEGDPIPLIKRQDGEDVLNQVKRSKILRVGYRSDIPPFSYFNKRGELVGYDIALAHSLAFSLEAEIHFIPVQYASFEKDLEERRIDIAMASISVTPERLRSLLFSEPYITMERAFMTLDHRRNDFANLEDLKEIESLNIGVLKGSVFEKVVQEKLPEARITLLNSYNEFIKNDQEIDALIWGEAEATTWSLIHPNFSPVIPIPSLGREIYAFALPPEEDNWTDFVNYWLDLKKLDGFTEEQKKLWLSGEVPNKEPRWSIIRNVLHWID